MLEYLIVMAQLSGQEEQAAERCRQIEDDVQRLACYDQTFGRSMGGAAATTPASPPPEVKAADFGLTEQQRNRKEKSPPAIEMIESRITAIEPLPYDRYTLVLENGQKWTLVEPTPVRRFRVGDAITIRKAAFESYLARGPNAAAGVHVRRLD